MAYQTLFLDRDGVINEERPNDYVKSPSEFIFLPRVLDALGKLNHVFSRIFIVTNQRGVGKGVMTPGDLQEIHQEMLREIRAAGGRIDNIYVCTDISSDSINRKPNTGMALQAKNDFSDIDFNSSIMVGNSLSDLQFGRNAGMLTVLVGDKYTITGENSEEQAEEKKQRLSIDHSLFDYYFDDLHQFSESALILQ